jgi:hypothetical protein
MLVLSGLAKYTCVTIPEIFSGSSAGRSITKYAPIAARIAKNVHPARLMSGTFSPLGFALSTQSRKIYAVDMGFKGRLLATNTGPDCVKTLAM